MKKSASKIVFLTALLLAHFSLKGQKVHRMDPPNWWINHPLDTVEILLQGEDLFKWAAEVELDEELAKADAEIAARTEEAAAALAEIRNSAKAKVKTVAKATAKEIVAAMGGKADAKSVTAAVTERMKG